MSLRTKPKTTLNLAAQLRLSNTKFNFSIRQFGFREPVGKLNTICLPISITESTRKFLHVFNFSRKLFSFSIPSTCWFSMPSDLDPLLLHEGVAGVVARKTNCESLFCIGDTCEHFVTRLCYACWQYENSSQPRVLKRVLDF